MSLLRSIIWTIGRVAGLMLAFFLLGPVYYNLLDSMYDAAIGQSITELTTFANTIYGMFYWAFPSLTVFGIILCVAHLWMVARRRYYATEEM